MWFEKISSEIALKISKSLNLDNDKKEVIEYGAYILLDSLLAIGMVMLFGAIFNVFFQSLVISFTSALFRKTSGGAHATTSLRCASMGAVISVGFALIIKSLKMCLNAPAIVVYLIITFIISYLIVLKLAPKDSPNKPITRESKIKELKAKSLRTLFIYAIICLAILAAYYYTENANFLPYIALICTGYLWQAFTLTSFGHVTISKMELPFRYINLIGGEKK